MKKSQNNPNVVTPPRDLANDVIMTLWIVLVAFAYYAPVISPKFSRDATVLAPAYALMVIISVISLAVRNSRGRDG